jgi:hypothetical protein
MQYANVMPLVKEQATVDNEALMVTLDVIKALDQLNVPYLIGGSLASTLHGFSRTTLDSDLVADIRPEHVPILVQQLGDRYYLSDAAMYDAIRHRSSFNLIHLATMFKVDIFLPKARKFDRDQMRLCRQPGRHNSGQTGVVPPWRRGIRPAMARYFGSHPDPG